MATGQWTVNFDVIAIGRECAPNDRLTMPFVLPLKREDLARRPEDPTQYWVRQVLSIREIVTRLKECELAARQSGAAFVLDGGFDVVYSVLAHVHKVSHDPVLPHGLSRPVVFHRT